MKTLRLLSLIAACAALVSAARAQWQNVTYNLHGGWNAIYLHGDASYNTIENLVASNPEIVSIWRWNPNPNPLQFGSSPMIPTAGTAEWSTWTRNQPTQASLGALTGPAAYLIECSGAASTSYTLSLTQKVVPPRNTWVRNGANLLGFPTRLNGGAYPSFNSYFATFPVAVATNTKIYRYAGGPLGVGNPVQVFSTNVDQVDRNKAYWFDAAVVSDFYAPFEVSPSNFNGLIFGRSGSQFVVRLRNRTSATATITVAPTASASAPAGQQQILAAVPLTRREYDSGQSAFVDRSVDTAFNVVIGPQSSVELTFGVDRAQITGSTDALYASLLRFTDSGSLMDVSLPVSAQVTSMAGLWVGDVAVNAVDSLVPGETARATSRSYPLRVLLHVDNNGTARLLSQVFLGRLAPAPHDVGIATVESALKADDKANARRLTAANLPIDTVLGAGGGTVALGATLTRTVTIPFNASTNPFVHEYHPDHDNRDARGNLLTNPVEAPNIAREISFTFATTPPAGSTAVGWGSAVLGGTYTEKITGLHNTVLNVSGTFELRRVSEIGDITTN